MHTAKNHIRLLFSQGIKPDYWPMGVFGVAPGRGMELTSGKPILELYGYPK